MTTTASSFTTAKTVVTLRYIS